MVKKSTKSSVKTTKVTSKSKTAAKSKTVKKTVVKNKILEPDLSYLEGDKILKKVERYVDKNREKTSQEILERKSNRWNKKFQEADLEVMISRIDAESKPDEKTKEISKRSLYIIYIIVFMAIMIFMIKYFFI